MPSMADPALSVTLENDTLTSTPAPALLSDTGTLTTQNNAAVEEDISILSTSYMPNPAEAELIRLRCTERAAELDGIDKLLKELTERKSRLVEASAIGSALLAPIRKIQPELLAEIFSYCIPTFSFPGSSKESSTFEAMGLYGHTSPRFVRELLGGICKTWKMVLDNTPRLWSTLVLDGHLRGAWEIGEHLEMNKCVPLDMYIDMSRSWFSWQHPNSVAELQACFTLLREAIPRVRRVDATVFRIREAVQSPFPPDSLILAPALESLVLSQSHRMPRIPLHDISISAPSLHTLVLKYSVDLLAHFTEDTLANLRSLCLKFKDLDLGLYLPLLSHCSKLEHLDWTDCDRQSSEGDDELLGIISLPSLKTFRFIFFGDISFSTQLIGHIHAPHLTNLEIDTYMDDTSITNTVVAILQGNLQGLQHIRLCNVEIGASFSELLKTLVGLRSLTLDSGCSCDSTIFDVFCPQDANARPGCEELSRLEFCGAAFPLGPMISFIYRSAQGGREIHKKMYPVQVSSYSKNDPTIVHFAEMYSDIIVCKSIYERSETNSHSGSAALDDWGMPVRNAWNNFARPVSREYSSDYEREYPPYPE